uniref:helix-turn-helix transcriptional regulator n=1 Tax=Endozoicomonas sp. Mp262 TaxID=2919499 RepID=UPI00351BE2DE
MLDRQHMYKNQLAHAVGVSSVAVNKWTRGKSLPSLLMLMQICEALDATPNSLLIDMREDRRRRNGRRKK